MRALRRGERKEGEKAKGEVEYTGKKKETMLRSNPKAGKCHV